MDRKLAVFFPGIGYTIDKPLMYYSRKIAAAAGYEIKLLPYAGFPDKIQGDADRIQESYRIALTQSEEMLAGMDMTAYDEIVFIGKSIGTVVAAELADRYERSRTGLGVIRLVLYTPLEQTFLFPLKDAIVFTGSDDPWVGKEKSRIGTLCVERKIPYMLIPHGNHSLESGNIQEDMEALKKVLLRTEAFLRKNG